MKNVKRRLQRSLTSEPPSQEKDHLVVSGDFEGYASTETRTSHINLQLESLASHETWETVDWSKDGEQAFNSSGNTSDNYADNSIETVKVNAQNNDINIDENKRKLVESRPPERKMTLLELSKLCNKDLDSIISDIYKP